MAFVALASRPEAAAGALEFGVVVSKDGVAVGLISVYGGMATLKSVEPVLWFSQSRIFPASPICCLSAVAHTC
jgi:hypothetical protein